MVLGEPKFVVYGVDSDSKLVFNRVFDGHYAGYDAIDYMCKHVDGFEDAFEELFEEDPGDDAWMVVVDEVTYLMIRYDGRRVDWNWYD